MLLRLQSNDQKEQKAYDSGKKKRHTLKSQVVIDGRTRQVIWTAHGRGTTHDFALYKHSRVALNKELAVLADSGYQGLDKLHGKSQTPRKKPRKGQLSKEEKRAHRELSRRRIVIEKGAALLERRFRVI